MTISNQEASVGTRVVERSPDESLLQQEIDNVVKSAVEKLPDHQRAVVVLRIWNEMSYREIAETVERTESTVRSYMFHALKSLRESLEPEGL